MKDGKKTFSVLAHGDSMYPLLQDGDVIEYIKTPFVKIQYNDIILAYTKNIFLTHRVIYKTKKTCITRGDNNPSADLTIQNGKTFGKVVRFKRSGHWYGLQDIYFAQSALYLAEIRKLSLILERQKIPHIFLKGVLISLRYEGAIPKRIYADCDILVKRDECHRLYSLFNKLGYTIQKDHFSISNSEVLENRPEVTFYKVVHKVPIAFDVHFEPVFLMTKVKGMNNFYSNKKLTQLGNGLIERGKLQKINGVFYRIPSAADQILYLILHIFHHNYTDSIRYHLLDVVIRKKGTSKVLGEVFNTVKKYNLEGYVFGVVILLKKYFKTPISTDLINRISPSMLKKIISSYFIHKVDIFSQDDRINAGINRFFLIFFLSPNPLLKKIGIFFHKDTLKSILSISVKKIMPDNQ